LKFPAAFSEPQRFFNKEKISFSQKFLLIGIALALICQHKLARSSQEK